jgi:diguanylate cyclase (GGDEF)-like protein
MNIHPDLIRQLSLVFYVAISAIYLFQSYRFKAYLLDPHQRLTSFWAFITIPLFALLFRPEYDFFFILALLQLSFVFSLLVGVMFHKSYANVFNGTFALTSIGLLGLCLMRNPLDIIFTLDLHWIGTANALICILILLIINMTHDVKLHKSTLVFIFLGSLLSAFKIPTAVQLIVQIFYTCALLDLVRLQASAIDDQFIQSMTKTQKIEKDFKDAVRKEVNKHMFYHELSKDKIKAISQTDDLTKSLNKKAFMNLAGEMIQDKTPFALLMFDIDKFKTINDTLGHVVGDMCLKNLSVIAKRCIRDNDVLARYGGDEFIILLPNSDFQNAIRIAERFRTSIAQTEDPHYTVSIGISMFPADGTDIKTLIQCADAGLYASKHKGRNQVSYKS